MKTLSPKALANRQEREAETIWRDSIELRAREALNEIVELKTALATAASDVERRAILWKITTYKDSITALVDVGKETTRLKSVKRIHSSFAVQKKRDELIKHFERNPKLRRANERRICNLREPGRAAIPVAEWAAIKRNRDLIAEVVRYHALNGEPSNVADVLQWLRDEGFPIVNDNENTHMSAARMSARTVREIVTKVCGITGRKGRKPKVL